MSGALRFSVLRNGLKWGHQARPYFINGLIKQELTHTQAESFPNLADRFWNLSRRFRKEAPYWVLGSLPFIYRKFVYTSWFLKNVKFTGLTLPRVFQNVSKWRSFGKGFRFNMGSTGVQVWFHAVLVIFVCFLDFLTFFQTFCIVTTIWKNRTTTLTEKEELTKR